MSTITPTITPILSGWNLDGWKVAYASMGSADTGATISFPGFADKSVQVEGTFGVGGTVVVEGSNDGSHFETLNDPFNNPVSVTSVTMKAITEACISVRPRATAGDGTTSLNVTIFFRKTSQP
jgi:hypothetical protein